jgi:N-acetylglutamate synthase-like GNAT family acetyltransferase
MTTLRRLSVDELSTARYIHTASFTGSAPEHYSSADIEAFNAFVRSPRYADLLLGNNAVAAWIDTEMVGTAAWSPGEGRSPTARIVMVAVRPLFTGEGIGRLLVDHIEAEAREAGFQALEVSATLNSVGFFEGLGFRVVRGGEWALPLGHEIPVAFMRKADFVGLHAAS